MDKSKLLDQCGALGEDRTLLARVLDRAKQASERNIPAATDFLSPAQQAQAADLLHAAGIPETAYIRWGGYDGAERAVFLFLLLPSYIFTGIEALLPTEPMNALSGLLPGLPEGSYVMVKSVDISGWRTVFEGVMKIVIFVAYMWVTSLTKDMHRMYRYHGAEHKTIACYEAGKPLTVENIRPMTRFHPRCGTSFIIITLLVSILVYSVVPITPELFKDLLNTSSDTVAIMLRTVCKLLLLPIVVGFAYELIKLAGRCDNIVTRIFSAPGLWMQRITTKEPDDSMIEVAIAAVTPCLPKEGEDDNW